MKSLFLITFLIIFSVVSFSSCKPAYSVSHYGKGVYVDTFLVKYRSGNLIDY